MANSFIYFILFIYYIAQLYCNGEICKPEIMTGPPIPTLPKQYYARIEIVLPDMNMAYLAEEYYNYDENRFVLRQHGAQNSITFFDMKNMELFFINLDEQTCYKENETSRFFDKFLLNVIAGQSHISSANQLMNLDPSMFKRYSGTTVERGYEVHQWTFCIDHVTDIYDIRGEVTWYWKGPESEWFSAANETSFPIKAIVKIDVLTGNTTTSFKTEMNYYWWSTAITEDLERQITSYLNIPPGIACENKKITQSFPDFPRKMQLRVDVSIPSEGIISQADEWYDFDAKIFRVTYRNIPPIGLQTECTLYTYVYDEKIKQLFLRFSDQPNGFCSTQTHYIPPEEIYQDNFHLNRIVYYENFFGTNEVNKKRYSYMGERNETDILCNIWSAVRNDWPYSGVKTAWEWAFSKDLKTAPVKLSIRIISIQNENSFLKQGETYILNYYEFTTHNNVPDTVYDISECYDYSQKAVAKFTLGGDLNRNIFTYELENALLKNIAQTIGINQLRISRLMIRFEEDPVVYFQLLDRGETENNESDLYTSFKNLCHAVQNCKLKTTIKNKYSVWPLSNTLKSTSSKNELNCSLKSVCNYEKFTTDVMAGLGIAFLAIGILFGALVIFIYMHLLKKTKLS